MIKFGTSGYRGIINESFTNHYLSVICYALKEYFNSILIKTPSIAIAYDCRQGNDPLLTKGSFTHHLVQLLRELGINIYFCNTYTPTPVLSWFILDQKLDGGLVLTASHNPPNYNGIKFNDHYGAPANLKITSFIEQKANDYFNNQKVPMFSTLKGTFKKVDLAPQFAYYMHNYLKDMFLDNKKSNYLISNLNLIIDTKHGACSETWQAAIDTLSISKSKIIHSKALSNFGDKSPNPTDYPSLNTLISKIKEDKFDLGVSNDPDGDRHILIDETGRYLKPEETACIIIELLLHLKLPLSTVATTVASSGILKSIAKKHSLSHEETKIGFKFFSDFFLSANSNQSLCIGVESSGGISISNHTYEKCGFLPAILILVAISIFKKPLSKLLQDIYEKYGHYIFLETSYHYDSSQKNILLNWIDNVSLNDSLLNYFKPIKLLDKTDGIKIYVSESSWVLFRLSGTEPVIRIYAESMSSRKAKILIDCSRKVLNGLFNK
ncbi:hypothetical protein DID75_00690 [Candidatus Marinamargulisbacteria bacterium SCGC AG-410-N11]|nr:hypothetical protein DID75_00690 [Candidatus Marinamargulisbacteria bacterium SCGC AG-410-N11]